MMHYKQYFHSAKIGWQYGWSALKMAFHYWSCTLACVYGGIISWLFGGNGEECH
jgi:hypothetical protein